MMFFRKFFDCLRIIVCGGIFAFMFGVVAHVFLDEMINDPHSAMNVFGDIIGILVFGGLFVSTLIFIVWSLYGIVSGKFDEMEKENEEFEKKRKENAQAIQ